VEKGYEYGEATDYNISSNEYFGHKPAKASIVSHASYKIRN